MSVSFPVPDIILPQMRASSSSDVLKHMTKSMALSVGADAAQLYNALVNADKTGGSAIGNGVAVVGARVPREAVGRRVGAFATLVRPVMFHGIEDRPCDLVFVMAAPDDEVQKYIRDLSTVVRTLKDTYLLECIREAESAERIMSLFKAKDVVLKNAA